MPGSTVKPLANEVIITMWPQPETNQPKEPFDLLGRWLYQLWEHNSPQPQKRLLNGRGQVTDPVAFLLVGNVGSNALDQSVRSETPIKKVLLQGVGRASSIPRLLPACAENSCRGGGLTGLSCDQHAQRFLSATEEAGSPCYPQRIITTFRAMGERAIREYGVAHQHVSVLPVMPGDAGRSSIWKFVLQEMRRLGASLHVALGRDPIPLDVAKVPGLPADRLELGGGD
ncbi:hypothetical protein BC826DRAFT_1141578 [Russula brevipes]|nr:hypothetical protein BC826DRAFT_1141578 [Russula brevipes]